MAFVCDICERSYQYKRNLKRHKEDRHSSKECWNCVVVNCSAKFIRRSYLHIHLQTIHKFSKVVSREVALKAERGDSVRRNAYYEDISDDDSILDLLPGDGANSADETLADDTSRSTAGDGANNADETLADDESRSTADGKMADDTSPATAEDVANIANSASTDDMGNYRGHDLADGVSDLEDAELSYSIRSEAECSDSDADSDNHGNVSDNEAEPVISETESFYSEIEDNHSNVSDNEAEPVISEAEPNYSEISDIDDDDNVQQVVIISDDELPVDRCDNIRRITQFYAIRREIEYTYGGDDIIAVKEITVGDKWFINH